VNFNINFKGFSNLIKSAFVGELTLITLKCTVQRQRNVGGSYLLGIAFCELCFIVFYLVNLLVNILTEHCQLS